MRLRGDIGGLLAPRTPSPKGPVGPFGNPLPPLCRPAGWIALWKRMAMVGKLNARSVG